MSLPQDIFENLRGFSKAMYSTWFYYPPAGIMLDAGEGAASRLANTVFGVRAVFLTHGHHDHIGGLPGIVLARNSAMGEKTLPLEVFHPAGDPYVQLQREYILHLARGLGYELSWKGLSHGEGVPLAAGSGSWTIQAFRTRHVRNQTTLGYKLVEKRTRLKSGLNGLSEREIAAIAKEKGREAVSEQYEHVLMAYSGDSLALDPADIMEAEFLIHDSTFLAGEDREFNVHASLDEALGTAADARVGAVMLIHVSTRYKSAEIEEKVRNAAKAMPAGMRVALFHNAKKIVLREP